MNFENTLKTFHRISSIVSEIIFYCCVLFQIADVLVDIIEIVSQLSSELLAQAEVENKAISRLIKVLSVIPSVLPDYFRYKVIQT